MVNKDRIVSDFCRLVEIDSPSLQEREMADTLTNELRKLGFEVTEDMAGKKKQGNCGNIYGFLKGEVEGNPLLFSSHMDTVEPSRNKKAIIHSDGTITGNGTTVLGADDLSGVVAILEALRVIKEKKIPHRSIEVLFTIAEEIYLQGSEVFDYSVIKAKEAYVLDLDGTIGTAARKAPSHYAFEVQIIGKASHAGFAPEQGINAISIAAEAIAKIKQGRIDEETTVNIGTIKGGKATNIVSEECHIMGEVRSLKHDKCMMELEKIRQVFTETAVNHGAELQFSLPRGYQAYEVDAIHPVVERFTDACKSLQYPVKLIETFGGSDSNHFNRNGITSIVMACGMHKSHSTEEYTHMDDLVKCSSLVLKLMTSK